MEFSRNWRPRSVSAWAVGLICAAIVAAPPAYADNHEEGDSICAPDVVEQVFQLRSHADALGFVLPSDAPEGDAVASHYRGIQRFRAGDGTDWLLLTRSGSDAGDLTIVRMGSRGDSPARLRSNRLARDMVTADTPPDESDEAVRIIFFNGSPDPADPEGKLGVLPHYGRASAAQLVGDILAVPLESKQQEALSEGRVLFFDLADPADPVRLAAEIGLDHPAGTLAIARRADGRYFVQISGPEGGGKNYYYVSSTDDLRDPATAFTLYDSWQDELLWGHWPTDAAGETSHSSFSFVRQCGDDRLFLIGTRSTEPEPGLRSDQIDVYEVFLADNPPDPATGAIDGTVSIGQVVRDLRVWCSFDGSGDTCNFRAAAGAYVAEDGELIVYASEYHNDGPADGKGKASVRLGEFRHRDAVVPGSSTYYPGAEAGGPYAVDEGSVAVLDATGSRPAKARPWVEIYDANCRDDGDTVVTYENGVQVDRVRPTCRGDRSVIVDWASRDDDDYDDLTRLDGFDDRTSAVRWWAPSGCNVLLTDESQKRAGDVDCSGDELPLFGSGAVDERVALEDEGFDDRTSCVRFNEVVSEACENTAMDFVWQWSDDPVVGTLADGLESTAGFHAIDGPNRATVQLSVCAGPHCDVDSAEIDILNVAPAFDSIIVPAAIDENDVLNLSVAWSDPGVIDTHTLDVTWGDGAGESSGVLDVRTYASGHRYLDDDPSGTAEDPYAVDLLLTDKDGDSDAETVGFVVRNVAPVAVFEGFAFADGRPVAGTALIGIPVIARSTFTDVGTLDTHTATYDWDDGSTSGESEFDLFRDSLGGVVGQAADTRTFDESRVYSVGFSVLDDDLGEASATFDLRVRNAAGAVVDVVAHLKELLADPDLDPVVGSDIAIALADLEGNNGGRARNGAIGKLTGGQYNAAMIRLARAIDALARAESWGDGLDLSHQKMVLALAAKSLTLDVIAQADAASDRRPHQRKVDRALEMVARGDVDLAEHDYHGAASSYHLALRRVQGLAGPQPGLDPEAGYETSVGDPGDDPDDETRKNPRGRKGPRRGWRGRKHR